MDGSVRSLRELAESLRGMVEEIGVEGLEAMLVDAPGDEAAPIVIDVREDDEWATGRIPGAIHVPLGVLEREVEDAVFAGRIEPSDLSRRVAVCCAAGVRSLVGAAALRGMGFERAFSVAGGMHAWRAAGLPVEGGSS